MIKCVFFDFDGTIADSMPYWEKSSVEDLKARGIEPPEDLLVRMSFMNFIDSTKFILKEFNLPDTLEEAAARRRAAMERYYATEVPLVKDADRVLSDLKERGIKSYITTVSSETMMMPCLKRLDVLKYFDGIFSCDDVPYPKTDERFFIEAARKYGFAHDEVLVVDDSYGAIKTGRDVGMRTLGIYEKYSDSNWKRICDTADYHIASFSEWDDIKEELLK
ncbi:MAG: HAD family phosphatase [Erysipelotrichaceae bacterium]|nr:HAD family phosphatase [Erysipelotrichaceae bacterium]